jgi:hypothetical protein
VLAFGCDGDSPWLGTSGCDASSLTQFLAITVAGWVELSGASWWMLRRRLEGRRCGVE